MTIFRRSAGLGTFLLSVLGLLLCVAGAIGVWAGKARLAALEAAVFATADEALGFMETKLDQVKHALESGRQRVSVVSKMAERLREADVDVAQERGPLLQKLGELFDELKSTEHWLDSSQAIAQGVTRVSEAIAESDAVARRGETAVAIAARVQEFSQAVAEVIARLQAVRQEIIEMRENREVAREIAARVVSRLAEMNGKLEHSAARVAEVSAQVTATRAACADLARRVGMWVTAAAVVVTLVLAWFGISQIGMMGYARRMARTAVQPGA